MSIADPEKALSLVEEFRDLLLENKTVYDQGERDAAKAHHTHQELLRRLPWIERIEAEVNPVGALKCGRGR